MTSNSDMKLQRLFGAAGVLLKAMRSHQGMNSNIAIHSPRQCTNATVLTRRYTLMELVDAMSMLIRIGIVPDARKGRQSSSRADKGRPVGTQPNNCTRAANCGTKN